MIQDIAPLTLNNHYDPDIRAVAVDSVLISTRGNIAVMEHSGELSFPTVSAFPGIGMTYLFSIGEERFFLPEQVPEALPDGVVLRDLRTLREISPEPLYRMYAAYTGKHLADWYRDTRFCGRCGQPMRHSETERAMTCTCGYTAYPRIMPAVIIGVINGDRILITRYRNGYRHNALVAGFIEIGETAEEAVAREVMEETGLRVKNIRYYKSQPWGSANDLLLGYYCDVEGDDTIRLDEHELGRGVWTRREEIELQPDSLSLTNEMMQVFREGASEEAQGTGDRSEGRGARDEGLKEVRGG